MTNNLKCPFCSGEFDVMKGISESVLGCPKCKHIATIGVWEALIEGKKAQDALLFISNIRGAGMSYQDMFLDAHAVAKYALGQTSDLILIGRYAQDEIASITTGKDE